MLQGGRAAQVWPVVKSSGRYEPVSILLVEPDGALRKSLVNWLRGAMKECRVLEAATKEQAAIVAQAESPRTIVVDIAYPCLDGKETVRSIKTAAPWAAVVALTMCSNATYRECLASAGATESLLIWNTYRELPSVLRTVGDEEGEHQPPRTART